MMIVRQANERGYADHGWLRSFHTFSFADYHDPDHMGFHALRVINEDRVEGGKGFGTHGHRDMEILSYVLEGALAHRDSTGNGSIIRSGDVQRMSAGTGVRHSEHNASRTELVHFLQIWVQPGQIGIEPGYEQKTFPAEDKRGKLRLVASPDGRDGSLLLHSNQLVRAGLFSSGESAVLPLDPARHAWVQVARGKVRVNGQALSAGDGAALSAVRELRIEGVPTAGEQEAGADGEVLVFDLA
jgi:quercetin 2,3-dioxygenase